MKKGMTACFTSIMQLKLVIFVVLQLPLQTLDVLVAAIHHYNKFIYFDLEDLWFISGKSESRTVLAIHDLVNEINTNFIDILPAIRALTGCDTTSKVGKKKKAIKKGNKNTYNLLCYFGKNEISESMIADAEKFLVQCITSDDTDNFDDLHFNVSHDYDGTIHCR